jgi:hypothetical protein
MTSVAFEISRMLLLIGNEAFAISKIAIISAHKARLHRLIKEIQEHMPP